MKNVASGAGKFFPHFTDKEAETETVTAQIFRPFSAFSFNHNLEVLPFVQRFSYLRKQMMSQICNSILPFLGV